MGGQQPPVHRVLARRRVDLGHIDDPQRHALRQPLGRPRLRPAQTHRAEAQGDRGLPLRPRPARRHADRGAVLFLPAPHPRGQQAAVGQRAILRRAAQQMGRRRILREQAINIALAVHHRRDLRRRAQQVGRHLRPVQPAARLLLLRRPAAPVRHLARGAVQHGAVQHTDHPAIGRIHRQDRMQEQADIRAVAARAEAALARRVGRKMQLGRVLDRQHVPPRGASGAHTPGSRQHLHRGHRRIGQEPAKLDRLIAVPGQPMHAQRPPLLHRRQQRPAHTRQSLVTKPPKARLDHPNRTLCQTRCAPSIRTLARRASHSGLEWPR